MYTWVRVLGTGTHLVLKIFYTDSVKLLLYKSKVAFLGYDWQNLPSREYKMVIETLFSTHWYLCVFNSMGMKWNFNYPSGHACSLIEALNKIFLCVGTKIVCRVMKWLISLDFIYTIKSGCIPRKVINSFLKRIKSRTVLLPSN